MFELIEVKIDPDKVAKYRKYDSTSPTFLDTKAYTLVPSEYRKPHFAELDSLFIRYKVASVHLPNLLYIIGQHLFIYQIIREKKASALECYESLKFLHSYQFQTNQIVTKSKNESVRTTKLASRYFEVKLPNYKDDAPITLGNTDFVVKAIYQLFKQKYDFSLKHLLIDHDDIPPLEILTKLLNDTKYLLDHATHYFIAEITEDLLDYLNTNMAGELSRKQYLFISDLLLINAVFHLADDKETEVFELTTDFKPENLNNISKTTYLKRVLKNYRKHLAKTQ
ncbi:MAG: hypothetical protein EOO42_16085 [Flavobacteriales bacterium]|nr:MAG: hypothetical protein EOO42_16085 [Flavobacteriales bacterium]